ncbi:MAG: hypothetical protein Q8K63_15425 [Acidimicrobiales bacterium]|nr:hypothetical protein [Acidimicrobiales bacterium]
MRKIAAVVCLLSLAFAACGKDDDPAVDNAIPDPTKLTITSVENNGTYGFNVPTTITVDSVAAITLDNSTAKEPHQAAMLKVSDGKTLDDVKAFLSNQGAPTGPPPFSVGGGTTAVDPGGKIDITQTLPSGTYAFFCFVPDATGVPHFAKGMTAQVEVTGNSTTSLPLPDGENSTSTEFGYELPSLKAGVTTLRTLNKGKQDHEYQFGLLADGKKAEDALAWLSNPQGPPPFSHIGGPVIGVGGSNAVRLNLKSGAYVVFCNIPDQSDGKPHSSKGMFQGFTVT